MSLCLAMLCQLSQAIHQAAIDNGSWEIAWLSIYLQNEKVAPEKLAQDIFYPSCDSLSQNETHGGAEVGPIWGPMGPISLLEPKWDPRGGGGGAHLGAHGALKPVFGVYLGGVFFGGGRLPFVLF